MQPISTVPQRSRSLVHPGALLPCHAMLLLPPVPLALALVTGLSPPSPSPTWCVAPPVWIITRPLPLSDPISVAHLKKGHTLTHPHVCVHSWAPAHTP